MLIRFAVSNFRSIRDELELSMVAADAEERESVFESRRQDALGLSLLTQAAVYGPNASGKTSVALSLLWLKSAVVSSLLDWSDSIPTNPFRTCMDQPSSFTLDVFADGTRYEYALDIDRDRVLYEAAFVYEGGERVELFERDGDAIDLAPRIVKSSAIRELLTDRTLALSVARRYREAALLPLIDSICRTEFLGVDRFRHDSRSRGSSHSTRSLFGGDSLRLPGLAGPDGDQGRMRERAVALLRLADLGIRDVRVEASKAAMPDGGEAYSLPKLKMLHTIAGTEIPFDLADESDGTLSWFEMIGPVLHALEQGSTIVVDELDRSLHPTLSATLLDLFHDVDSNPRGAQLVFTSHDTSLMSHLRSDEIWLTEKRDGATVMQSLASYRGDRVRRSERLGSGYLAGRFGAIPDTSLERFLRGRKVAA